VIKIKPINPSHIHN